MSEKAHPTTGNYNLPPKVIVQGLAKSKTASLEAEIEILKDQVDKQTSSIAFLTSTNEDLQARLQAAHVQAHGMHFELGDLRTRNNKL